MSTNYYNPLAIIDVSALSEKGQQQVNDFIDYLRPRYCAIKDGELTKEEVARHYLEMESSYTDGAKARISTLTDGLGISKGYLSKIRSARKLLERYSLDRTASNWIDEHPVSCQYLMGKVSHNDLYKKLMTGTHFTRSELEIIIKNNKEEAASQPADETKADFQLQQERYAEMVEDESYKYITNSKFAQTFMAGTTNSAIAACMEKVSRLTTCDEKREKQLLHLMALCEEALRLPRYYQTNTRCLR